MYNVCLICNKRRIREQRHYAPWSTEVTSGKSCTTNQDAAKKSAHIRLVCYNLHGILPLYLLHFDGKMKCDSRMKTGSVLVKCNSQETTFKQNKTPTKLLKESRVTVRLSSWQWRYPHCRLTTCGVSVSCGSYSRGKVKCFWGEARWSWHPLITNSVNYHSINQRWLLLQELPMPLEINTHFPASCCIQLIALKHRQNLNNTVFL